MGLVTGCSGDQHNSFSFSQSDASTPIINAILRGEEGALFFVTFHETISNVYAFDDNGNQLSDGVLNPCSGYDLKELRGIYSANDFLYVVNGDKSTSNVLCFQGSGTSYSCVDAPFIAAGNPINHPFAMAFDGVGHAFVSNQDSNVVVTLDMPSNTKASLPTGWCDYLQLLYPGETFLNGTLAASAVSPLYKVPTTTAVPLELGGLGASVDKDNQPQNSVRDVLYYSGNNGLLFVADEPTNIVRIYNPSTGQPLRCSGPVPGPTHLTIQGSTLYVSAGSQVFTSAIPNPYDPNDPVWVFKPLLSLAKGAAAGTAFDNSGKFYVANRTGNVVEVYDSNNNFAPVMTWPAFTDNPEFLLYMGE